MELSASFKEMSKYYNQKLKSSPTLTLSVQYWHIHHQYRFLYKIQFRQNRKDTEEEARYVTDRYPNTLSDTNMIYILGWKSHVHRWVDTRLCLMFKIVNELVAIPCQNYLIPFTRSSCLPFPSLPNPKFKSRLPLFTPFSPAPSVFGILFRSP